MAFYQFLAIFPSLLIGCTVAARIPHLGPHLRDVLLDLSTQVFPNGVSQLFQRTFNDFSESAQFNVRLLSVGAGAVWAAHNGTWAMIYGLNRAYEVEESRSWWKLTVTIVGLTLCLVIAGSLTILLIVGGASFEAHLHGNAVILRGLEWLILITSTSCSFALLFRVAPNLPDYSWRWSTPGTFCALVLWIVCTFLARIYFDHVNDYTRSYGHLNGVVMLLLWLYASNGAILIGGEMNSEIRKAAAARGTSTK